jgi:hypothetical protein
MRGRVPKGRGGKERGRGAGGDECQESEGLGYDPRKGGNDGGGGRDLHKSFHEIQNTPVSYNP